MPWVEVPSDYEIAPGDLVQFTIGGLGWVAPPVSLVEYAMSLSSHYQFESARYEGSDLILEVRVLPPPEGPEVIKAGTLPMIVIYALAAAGVGLVYFLIVKKVRIQLPGGIEIETSDSLSGVMLLALAGAGLYLYSQSRGARA